MWKGNTFIDWNGEQYASIRQIMHFRCVTRGGEGGGDLPCPFQKLEKSALI